jgi:hypothetical protein
MEQLEGGTFRVNRVRQPSACDGGLDKTGHGAQRHRFIRLIRVRGVGNLC